MINTFSFYFTKKEDYIKLKNVLKDKYHLKNVNIINNNNKFYEDKLKKHNKLYTLNIQTTTNLNVILFFLILIAYTANKLDLKNFYFNCNLLNKEFKKDFEKVFRTIKFYKTNEVKVNKDKIAGTTKELYFLDTDIKQKDIELIKFLKKYENTLNDYKLQTKNKYIQNFFNKFKNKYLTAEAEEQQKLESLFEY